MNASMSEESPADPFRETIRIARGPNVDGQHAQAVAAQGGASGDEATARERAMSQVEDAALTTQRASAVGMQGIEDGEGDEEGIGEGIAPADTSSEG